MGNTWEVYAYMNTSKSKNEFRYEYVQTWCGQSLIKCIFAAIKAKRASGCVKIEWR